MTRGLPGPGLIPLALRKIYLPQKASKEPPFPLSYRLEDEAPVT